MVRYRYVIAGFLLLYILFAFVFLSYHSSNLSLLGNSKGAQSVYSMNISSAINYTKAYLLSVNDSAYIIFYPNNAKAYAYLEKAENLSKNDTTSAYALLANAIDFASHQESNIYRYQEASIITMAVLAVISGFILFKLMFTPVKIQKKAKRR